MRSIDSVPWTLTIRRFSYLFAALPVQSKLPHTSFHGAPPTPCDAARGGVTGYPCFRTDTERAREAPRVVIPSRMPRSCVVGAREFASRYRVASRIVPL
jgi:hypothetical protein